MKAKQAEPKAKSRSAGNNRVRLEAARRTIEELESASVKAAADEMAGKSGSGG